MRSLLLLILILFSSYLGAQPSVYSTYAIPLSGVTLAGASAPISTRPGPTMHLLRVEFPTAGGTVSPIQVRLEFTFDGTLWLPLSDDILSVPILGGQVYAFEKAYGVFPAIRVNSLVNVPGGVGTMTVRYVGMALPVANFLTLLSDRYAF